MLKCIDIHVTYYNGLVIDIICKEEESVINWNKNKKYQNNVYVYIYNYFETNLVCT